MSEKKSRGARLAGWAVAKVRKPEFNELSKRSLRDGVEMLMENMSPTRLDKAEVMAGINGRYRDGGVSRFSEMMRENNISERDLPEIERTHLSIARSYAVMTAVAVITAIAFIVLGSGQFSFLGAMVLMIFGFSFLAVAVKHDFSAWQIRMRRFAGFREYLDLRFAGLKRV